MLLLLPAVAFATPIFSVDHGQKEAAFELTITPESSGNTVLYSLSGAAPTTRYSAPLTVDHTTVVRAVERAPDGTLSAVVTATYLFVDDVLTSSVMDPTIVGDPGYGPVLDRTLRDLPSISLVTPSTISTTEQEGSFEWMDPDGEDGQFECGMSLSGTTSLGYPKNSIRLYFRGEYGDPQLHLDLFGAGAPGYRPVDQFDAVSLRSGNHDTEFYRGAQGQHLRNRWMDESQLDMGHVAPHGRFAHLYVNGVYNGLYHVRERFGAAMMAGYLGGEEEDYEAINGGSVYDGSGAAWASLVAAGSNYAVAQRWLNVRDFLDYMVLNFYAGNAWDWSAYHNWAAAGPTRADQGGFVFESSDSDICLYYDYTVNILDNPGPSYLFGTLWAEGDPDFQVALEDAIHRNLQDGGPLTEDVASGRYARIAAEIDDAVVAESARWGYGWWDHDGEWVPERDRLFNDYFPYRTAELLRQMRAVGWYTLPAPELDPAPSESGELVPAGTVVTVSTPLDADLYVSIDGTDPRLSGGDVSPTAEGPVVQAHVPVDHSLTLRARLKSGDTWGPEQSVFYEVEEAPPVILNEWNAVDADEYLGGGDATGTEADAALGRMLGNGGDWIELLVVQDHADLRGWRLSMQDRSGPRGELTFTYDPLLGDLRAGTIVTIAEDLAADAAYDPDGGDWRFHLRASASGSGRYVSAADFDVTSADWQLTMRDAAGYVRFGPAGEGVSPTSGISGKEVGLYAADPDVSARRTSAAFMDAESSTYGAPNVWDGGAQDLTALRGLPPGRTEGDSADTSTDTSGGSGDTSADTSGDTDAASNGGTEPGDTASADKAGGCGCATSGAAGGSGGAAGAGGLATMLVALGVRRRAGRLGSAGGLWLLGLLGLAGCAAGGKADGDTGGDNGGVGDNGGDNAGDNAGDNGGDNAGAGDNSGGDNGGGTGDTAASCYEDDDGDGYGDPAHPADDCAGSPVHDATDCDDDDPAVHPGVPESCDGIDDDCDGRIDDADDDVVDGLPFYTDGDGDGYGGSGDSGSGDSGSGDGGMVRACAAHEGYVLLGGDCDDADPDVHPGATERCDTIDQDCDGEASDSLGAAADCPATSCLAVLEATGPGADGAYWLALPSGALAPVWCDQTTDGGGWTLGFVRSSSSTGNQPDFGADYVSVDQLAGSPVAASTSASPVLASLDLNSFTWDELRLTDAYNGGETFSSANIPRASLRIAFGDDGYLLYGGDSPYYWCGGAHSYTDGGVGAVNNPSGAPAGCKGHGSLGSGWDFSSANSPNAGLTLCGQDGSAIMLAQWGATWVGYGTPGAAQAIWVR